MILCLKCYFVCYIFPYFLSCPRIFPILDRVVDTDVNFIFQSFRINYMQIENYFLNIYRAQATKENMTKKEKKINNLILISFRTKPLNFFTIKTFISITINFLFSFTGVEHKKYKNLLRCTDFY